MRKLNEKIWQGGRETYEWERGNEFFLIVKRFLIEKNEC